MNVIILYMYALQGCAVVRVLCGCSRSFARVRVRLGASVGSRNPVRKRVDACSLGGRAWMAPCHLRVGSCVTCRPVILGRNLDPGGEGDSRFLLN